MDTLARLLAEQSSPAEVLVFLVLVMVIFLVAAFLIYALLMALLKPGLPEGLPFRRVLFPGFRHLQENFGDYALAIATSALLTLTLMAKSQLVDQIANFEMTRVGVDKVASLLEFGLPAGLNAEIARSSVSDVVQPLLAAGKVDEASFLIRSVIALGLPDVMLDPRLLLILCLAISVLYIVWLARARVRALKASPDSAPSYARTFRQLLTLALCVGLLLASLLPLTVSGERLLANSAMEAMAFDYRQEGLGPVATLIAAEISKQDRAAQYLYCPDCPPPAQPLPALIQGGAVNVAGPPDGMDRLREEVAACRQSCDMEIQTLREAVGRLESRLAAVEGNADRFVRNLAGIESRLGGLDGGQQRQDGRLDRLEARLQDTARWSDQLRAIEGRLGGLDGGQQRQDEQLAGLESGLGETARFAEMVKAMDGRLGEFDAWQRRQDELLSELRGQAGVPDSVARQLRSLSQLPGQLADLDRRVNGQFTDLNRRVATLEGYHRQIIR